MDRPIATLTGTALGGTNWPGGAYDPETHTAYIFACNACLLPAALVHPPKDVSDMDYVWGVAGQRVQVARGPGENAGADSPLPTRAPAPATPPPPASSGGGGGGGVNFMTVQGLPLLKPPYGTISAIDLDHGDIVWQAAHGDTPDVVRNSPVLKGVDIPKTGQSHNNINVLVTKSLVIAGDGLSYHHAGPSSRGDAARLLQDSGKEAARYGCRRRKAGRQ